VVWEDGGGDSASYPLAKPRIQIVRHLFSEKDDTINYPTLKALEKPKRFPSTHFSRYTPLRGRGILGCYKIASQFGLCGSET
jgi:hypothetical protein